MYRSWCWTLFWFRKESAGNILTGQRDEGVIYSFYWIDMHWCNLQIIGVGFSCLCDGICVDSNGQIEVVAASILITENT